jgi:hypothetical protein
MYQKDMVRDIDPAMASPSSMINSFQLQAEAERNRADAVGKTIAAAGTVYETAKFMDRRQMEVDAEALQSEFLTSNMGAAQAGQAGATVDATAERMIDSAVSDPNFDAAAIDVINSLKGTAERLKEASAMGMSNSEYMTRVYDLTRKHIAKFPGLANDIRQAVGAITGLPGADRWAAQQYVAQRFGAQADGGGRGGVDPNKMVENDFKTINSVLGTPFEDLNYLYTNNPTAYRAKLMQAQELVNVKAQTTAVEEANRQAAAAGAVTAAELAPGFNALYQGLTADGLMTGMNSLMAEGLFNGYFEAARNGDVDSNALQVYVEGFRTRMLGQVQKGYQATMTSLANLTAEHNIKGEDYNQLKARINDQFAADKERWGDANAFSAMAATLAKYQDKSYTEQYNAYRLFLDELRIYPPDIINGFVTNPESVKAQYPAVYQHLEQLFPKIGQVRTDLSATQSRERTLVDAAKIEVERTGEAPVISDAAPPDTQKLVAESVMANGMSVLDAAAKGSDITPAQLNILKGAMDLSPSAANPVMLNNQAGKIREKVGKLDETARAEVAASISKGTVRSYTSIRSLAEGVQNKYGVKLEFGVNGAGQVVLVTGASVDPTTGMVRPSSPQYQAAVAEFNKVGKPLLMNIVNSRFVADTKDKPTIAKEFADLLNGNQPYTGFFSMEATPSPVAAAASPTSNAGKRATMADVNAFAEENDMSVKEAVDALKAEGWVVE